MMLPLNLLAIVITRISHSWGSSRLVSMFSKSTITVGSGSLGADGRLRSPASYAAVRRVSAARAGTVGGGDFLFVVV